MPRPFNYFRFLSVFTIVLFGFLALAASWLTSQQMSMLKASIDEGAKHDLETIADLSLESLLKSDYVSVRTFVDRWGRERQDYHLVEFVAPNGFVIAEHKNPVRHAGQTFSLTKDVLIGQTFVATVHLAGAYHSAEIMAAQLRNRLLLGAFLVTALLGAVLWYVINKLALQPLEAMVKERTRVLDETNTSLAQEIDERKILQKELQQREERISLLLDSIAEGVYGVDLDGNCTFCNPATLRLLGYGRPEELIGKHMHSLIHHTYPNLTPYPPAECGIYRCFREGSGHHVDDEVFWRADGTSLLVEYWAQPIIKDGAPVGAVTVFTDISQRKQSESDLKQLARDWQETFDASSAAIWVLDADQKVLRSNKTAERLFHLPLVEMIGKHCWEIAHKTQGPIDQCPACRSKKSLRRETMDLEMGGRWFQVTVDPIVDDNGQCIKYIHFVSDITDRIKIEQQLRQGQKMEAIGTLAGGIAHDFNNILSIMGNAELALRNAGDPEKVQQHLAQVGKGTERARELVKQILAFSRKSMEQRFPLQISLVIKEALKMLRASIPTTIEIKQQILSEGMVEADPTQIHQVLMNLCTNAYQAMQETGGTLTVRLEEVEFGAKQTVVAELPPGRYLKLTVSDTGVGIDPQIIDKIFEPYFTTKDKGKGTGLGLAVVHGIVMNHHGHMDVNSTAGVGTSFQVYLPMTQRQAIPLANATGTPAVVTGHGERILFVDDEELLCSLAKSIFSEHGYQVTTFNKPLQALDEFNARPDQFDLVMTDMTMPQITGTELSRRDPRRQA